MTIETQYGHFIFDFKPEYLFPGYNGTDYCIAANADENERITELYSAVSEEFEDGIERMVNYNKLNLEKMEPRLIEFLEYWLGCNENKILSEETLWWLLKKKVVNYEWTEWYRKRFKLKQPNFFLRTFYKLVEVK